MASDLHTEAEFSVTSLLKGIVSDAQELIQQQLALFRAEIKDDFRKTLGILIAIVSGAFMVAVGGALLCFMLVYLLNSVAPALPLWGCFGIVGGSVALIGGIVAYAAVARFKTFNPLPDESVQALKENVLWIKNRM
ncbi:MAG: phage holin family protein [Pirellulaceae bacterium]